MYQTLVDELNRLAHQEWTVTAGMEKEERKHRLCDFLLEQLIVAYVFGDEECIEELYGVVFDEDGNTTQETPKTVRKSLDEEANMETNKRPVTQRMTGTIFRKVKGLTFEDRVEKHVDSNNESGFLNLAETEFHYDYNEACFQRAKLAEKELGKIVKVWNTQLDDRVRDTHNYLEGVQVDLNKKFYTFDGDSAYYPGGFELTENNVNCRCEISYKTEKS